jgi:hypothetical protein
MMVVQFLPEFYSFILARQFIAPLYFVNRIKKFIHDVKLQPKSCLINFSIFFRIVGS